MSIRSADDGNSSSAAAVHLEQLSALLRSLPIAAVDRARHALHSAYTAGKTIFVFGNGGSAATASHIACDMGKGTVRTGHAKRLRIISLTDNVPLITAWANDSSFEDVFAEQLLNLVGPGDVALAISGSGRSRNVLKALRTARDCGAVTVGFAGFDGGMMKQFCDVCVIVPSDNMQLIEDAHHCIAHAVFRAICADVEERAIGTSASTRR